MNNHPRQPQETQLQQQTQKPLYFLRFRDLPFFHIKTDNPLILFIYIFFSLT